MIIGEKEKLTNKMNDKQGAVDILKHNTISHTKGKQTIEILSLVVRNL